MSVDPKDFDMPVASFNPNPMKLLSWLSSAWQLQYSSNGHMKKFLKRQIPQVISVHASQVFSLR